tara:strand:- start:947 stop:1204 length:258 start_codon:yes stop_codon:yes gene_type:complete
MAKVQKKLNEIHDSYRAVFNTKDGERVLEHLVKVGFVDTTTHTQGDPYDTAYKEGKRSIVISILRFIERDPRELLRLVQQGEENG